MKSKKGISSWLNNRANKRVIVGGIQVLGGLAVLAFGLITSASLYMYIGAFVGAAGAFTLGKAGIGKLIANKVAAKEAKAEEKRQAKSAENEKEKTAENTTSKDLQDAKQQESQHANQTQEQQQEPQTAANDTQATPAQEETPAEKEEEQQKPEQPTSSDNAQDRNTSEEELTA